VGGYGLQMPISVPCWSRGTVERAYIYHTDLRLNITALGGSVGTNGLLKAQVIVANGIEDLERLGEKNIKGKIVFFNKPFDPKTINGLKPMELV
jgi:carboxypeptidase Q